MHREKAKERFHFIARRLTHHTTGRVATGHQPTIVLVILAVMAAAAIGNGATGNDEEVPAFHEFRIICERNVFSATRSPNTAEHEPAPKSRRASAVTELTVDVVGIIKTSNRRSCIAIIQDNDRQLLCRIGDTVAGMLLTDIRASEVFFEAPDGTQIARIKPGTTRRRAIAADGPPASGKPRRVPQRRPSPVGRRLPLGAAEVRDLTRKLPLVARVEDGEVLGLQLTRDAIGLKKGDRVTHVGHQSLCTHRPKQRLWQIASKYRQHGAALPEIPLVVKRDNSEFEFVLVPSS